MVFSTHVGIPRVLSQESKWYLFDTQGVFKETMKAKGCNRFKFPHKGKGKLEKQGRPQFQLTYETSLLADSIITLVASSN
jgi:hypothetical protein